MLSLIIQGLILGVSFLVIFALIEFFRMATGKEILIDKMISHLQVVYRRSVSIDNPEIDWLGSDLPFKGRVIVLQPEDAKRK